VFGATSPLWFAARSNSKPALSSALSATTECWTLVSTPGTMAHQHLHTTPHHLATPTPLSLSTPPQLSPLYLPLLTSPPVHTRLCCC
jgi:hypothetical protein